MDIDELVKQAEELKSVQYDSPRVDLWKRKTKNFVSENYGQEYLKILDKALWFGQVIMSEGHGQRMHIEAMDKAIVFLNGLKTESQMDRSLSTNKTNTESIEVPQKRSYGNITISGGTVVFGDGNRITQVAVKELVDALAKEIEEKVPESEERRSVLSKLKEITTNETFASVAGTVIGEILRRVSH